MLTHRKNARRNLRHEANRAAGQVTAKAQGAVSSAGDAAKTARTGIGKLPHEVSDRAGRTMTGARRRAASRLFNTASRLSSAAEVVEHGRRPRRRRWPFVAAGAAVLGAVGVVVTKVARGMRGQTSDAGAETPSGDGGTPRRTGRAGDGERSARPDAMGDPQPAEASRRTQPVSSTAASGSNRNNDGR